MQPFGFDHEITDSIVSGRHESWTSLMQLTTAFGDTLPLTIVVIGVFVLAWLAGRIDFAALIVFGSVTGYLLMQLLKLMFARDRPPVEDRLIVVGGHAFPSGHAMLSTVVLGLTVIILHRIYPRVRERAAWLLIGPVLVLLIGFSRVYLGVHWTSDVLAGWLIGLFWVAVCVLVHVRGAKRRQAAREAPKPKTLRSDPASRAR